MEFSKRLIHIESERDFAFKFQSKHNFISTFFSIFNHAFVEYYIEVSEYTREFFDIRLGSFRLSQIQKELKSLVLAWCVYSTYAPVRACKFVSVRKKLSCKTEAIVINCA